MKHVEVRYKGLKVKHLTALSNLTNDTIKDKVELISNICEVDKSMLYRADIKQVNAIFDFIVKETKDTIEKKHKLAKTIEVNGKSYKFIPINSRQVGWYMDFTTIKINPETMMALNYIESEAVSYLELKPDGDLKYPLSQREEIMKDADLSYYMALNAFFLKKMLKIIKFTTTMEKINLFKPLSPSGLVRFV